MDQVKIGKFIQEQRKRKQFTQSELAEKLGVTDRAVSKWENGVCLPDANNMIELCKILDLTIRDLFCGEITDDKSAEKRLENALLEMKKEKENSDKKLLDVEIVLGILSSLLLVGCVAVACAVAMPAWARILFIVGGFVLFLPGILTAVWIEQTAGYYECAKCGRRYVPKYASVLLSMHVNRTRYMKCPCCGQRSWQKKVISETPDEDEKNGK